MTKVHNYLRRGVSRRMAVASVVVALTATALVCAVGASALSSLSRSYDSLTVRQVEVDETADRLAYLDEALTAAAGMAIATGDPAWHVRYLVLAREYDVVWNRAKTWLRGPRWSRLIQSAERHSQVLFGIENEALGRRAAERDAAISLIAAPPYAEAKSAYADALATVHTALRAEVARDRAAARRRHASLVTACMVLLPVVAISWSFAILVLTSYMRAYDASVQDLVQAEQRFDFASRAAADLVWDWNITSERVWFSDAFSTSFGYPESGEMDVNIWYAAIHPDDLAEVGKALEAAFAGDAEYWSGEYRMRRASGEWRDVLDRGYIVRDASGTAVRMVGALTDVTERRNAEGAAARLHRQNELILASVDDGIFGLDLNGDVLFINDAGARILGWTAEELAGKHLHSVAHHTTASGTPYAWADCAAHATLVNGTSESRRDEMFCTRNGGSVPVEYTSSPMLDENGATVGAVVAFRDISERRAIDKLKDEFISTVSHELRTPLTSIRGALGLLATGRLGALPPKADRLVEIAASNTDRLVRLINDILDVERIESGAVKLVKRSAVAGEIINHAVETVRALADEAQINIDAEQPALPIVCDTDRLVQTLTNLLANAVKFSPRGSTITVRCTLAGEQVLFTVADRGRGIPAEKLESVFERFQQVDASDAREKGGSGLGLAICRGIVRQHGGRIWAESVPGEGSTFSFTIPAERPRIPAAPVADEPGKIVLVCDDDDDARAMMVALLTNNGYVAREVTSGEHLLIAAREHADLILLDIFMPGMNGWETLARLRQEPASAETPVVIVSMLSAEETGVPLAQLQGWIEKPHVAAELVATVDRALSVQRRPRMLVIEDDADLAGIIASSFEPHGIEIIHAASGREAIDLAQQLEPDVIVLDLIMPDLDGFGFVDWLKDHDRWRGVPLVVYSALETTPSQRARLELGPTEFLIKSRVSPEEFERRIISLFDSITTAPKGQLSNVA